MAAKEMKIRKENKSCAGNYFKKAADNYEQMLEAFHAENWNATATLAVQLVSKYAVFGDNKVMSYNEKTQVLMRF